MQNDGQVEQQRADDLSRGSSRELPAEGRVAAGLRVAVSVCQRNLIQAWVGSRTTVVQGKP